MLWSLPHLKKNQKWAKNDNQTSVLGSIEQFPFTTSFFMYVNFITVGVCRTYLCLFF